MTSCQPFRLEKLFIDFSTVQRINTVGNYYRHIRSSAYKRIGRTVDQLARDTEIAQFQLTGTVYQHVTGFDVF